MSSRGRQNTCQRAGTLGYTLVLHCEEGAQITARMLQSLELTHTRGLATPLLLPHGKKYTKKTDNTNRVCTTAMLLVIQ